jgi:hypothetical protein
MADQIVERLTAGMRSHWQHSQAVRRRGATPGSWLRGSVERRPSRATHRTPVDKPKQPPDSSASLQIQMTIPASVVGLSFASHPAQPMHLLATTGPRTCLREVSMTGTQFGAADHDCPTTGSGPRSERASCTVSSAPRRMCAGSRRSLRQGPPLPGAMTDLRRTGSVMAVPGGGCDTGFVRGVGGRDGWFAVGVGGCD